MTAPTPSIDYVALKSGGIVQKDDDFFDLRLRLPGGSIPPANLLSKIALVARRHGWGEVRLTARAGIEIPWIKLSGEVLRIVVKK